MEKIKILIADSNFLIRKGLKTLIAENENWQMLAEAINYEEMVEKVKLLRPDLMIIDFSNDAFKIELIQQFLKKNASLKVLAITAPQTKTTFIKAIASGINSFLLTDCQEEEIIEAINKISKGEKFLCGKILNVIVNDEKQVFNFPSYSSCEGLHVTEREMEVIKYIAQGYSNKQIADILFLSTHTITTHRKNIMSKLNINNTAGIVLYAVREKLINPEKRIFSSAN